MFWTFAYKNVNIKVRTFHNSSYLYSCQNVKLKSCPISFCVKMEIAGTKYIVSNALSWIL